jgi:hypothetical protein
MREKILRAWDDRPLMIIMALAILFRLIAAIFAKGWGMIDDHFIVIESAQSWVDGQDYNAWLPGSVGNHGPTGHNLFYPGFHFLVFSLMNWMGLTDPQSKMLIIRIIHAGLSLITVYFGYRIAEHYEGKKSARVAGLLLAVAWFMPWMSVRNLVEMTTVPFVMLGYWMIIREDKPALVWRYWFLAGIVFGIAFNIRPQTVFFPLGIGIIALFRMQWKHLVALTAGTVICVTIFQGGIDYMVWGTPFAELIGYANVCINERNDYISLPWYNYFLTILALLIPPVSFFLLFGFFRNWKRYLIIFLPSALFFVFHSYFPNKQERFILPMIPLFIMMGSMGWSRFVTGSKFWNGHKRLLAACWAFFWTFNTILLFVFIFTYSKKARVEAMTYLSKYQDVSVIATIDQDNSPELMPKFYAGQLLTDCMQSCSDPTAGNILKMAAGSPPGRGPRFFLFTGGHDISPLVIQARQYFPRIVHETTIEPGFIDKFVHWLNPINKNRRVYIYRNVDYFPEKLP